MQISRENIKAVLAQSVAASKRGDFKHYEDFYARAWELFQNSGLPHWHWGALTFEALHENAA